MSDIFFISYTVTSLSPKFAYANCNILTLLLKSPSEYSINCFTTLSFTMIFSDYDISINF